jgi:hypothetical protein
LPKSAIPVVGKAFVANADCFPEHTSGSTRETVAVNAVDSGRQPDRANRAALLAAIDYELGDYNDAVRFAQISTTEMSTSVPELTSLTAIRKWMYPQAYLYGYERLFDGLRLAGLPEHDGH